MIPDYRAVFENQKDNAQKFTELEPIKCRLLEFCFASHLVHPLENYNEVIK